MKVMISKSNEIETSGVSIKVFHFFFSCRYRNNRTPTGIMWGYTLSWRADLSKHLDECIEFFKRNSCDSTKDREEKKEKTVKKKE